MNVFQDYLYLLQMLKDHFQLTSKKDGEHLHEMYEGSVPIFNLIMTQTYQHRDDRILMSFHLGINPLDAIQWYMRVKNLQSRVYMTECYFRDDKGTIFLGQDAEIIKMYKDEQRIISNWERDQEQTKKFIENPIEGKIVRTEKSFLSDKKDQALDYFNKLSMYDKDDESCH